MSDVETVVEKKVTENLNIKGPEKYQVIFVNDNFTPMEFVVKVLMSVFNHTQQDAEKIMIDILNEKTY